MRKLIVRFVMLLFVIACMLSGSRAFLFVQNNTPRVTSYTFQSERISNALSGFRIVLISDLHSKKYSDVELSLLVPIRRQHPDIIVISGDLVDSKREIEPAVMICKLLKPIAPVYVVSGNHDFWNSSYRSLKQSLISNGVHWLDGRILQLPYHGAQLQLVGIGDPETFQGYHDKWEDALLALCDQRYRNRYTVLLSHRPELFQSYIKTNVDLVLCGHAHGGQIRLPFIGGLYAPYQGWFPRYTSGVHRAGHTTMLITRGLGNSIFGQRLFNRPEITSITLQADAQPPAAATPVHTP